MRPGLRPFFQVPVLRIGFFTVVLCLFPRTMLAENGVIYRWVDPADKSIHYSQTAPAGVTYEKVRVESTPAEPDAEKRLQEMQKNLDESIKSRELNAEKQKQEAAEAAQRKQECKTMRERLTILETSPGKILHEDKSGQMQRMTEENRQQNIAKFKKQIEELCSPGH